MAWENSFELSVYKGYPQTCSLVLKHGEGPVSKDVLSSALGVCCEKGNEKVARLLLDAGADPWSQIRKYNRKSYRGALEVAILLNSEGCIRLLLEDPRALERCKELDYRPLIDASHKCSVDTPSSPTPSSRTDDPAPGPHQLCFAGTNGTRGVVLRVRCFAASALLGVDADLR